MKKIIIIIILVNLTSCSISTKVSNQLNYSLRKKYNIINSNYKLIISEKQLKRVLKKYFKDLDNKDGNYVVIESFDNFQFYSVISIIKNNKIQTYSIQKNQDYRITSLKNDEDIYSLYQIKLELILSYIQKKETYKLLRLSKERNGNIDSEVTMSIYVFKIKNKKVIVDEVISFDDFVALYSDSKNLKVREFGKSIRDED